MRLALSSTRNLLHVFVAVLLKPTRTLIWMTKRITNSTHRQTGQSSVHTLRQRELKFPFCLPLPRELPYTDKPLRRNRSTYLATA
jgi:hypothetical protein